MWKVMIVDDEELIRFGLTSKVKKSPLRITNIEQAASAEEALELAKSFKPDIVLCDIGMDGEDGLALSKKLTAVQPRVKIIIISGYNKFQYAQDAIRIGVVDYLLKPVDTNSLHKALEKCVEQIKSKELSSAAMSIVEKTVLQTKLRAYAASYLEARENDLSPMFAGYSEDSIFQAVYLYLDQSFFVFIDSIMDDLLRDYPRFALGKNLIYYEYRLNEYLMMFCLAKEDTDNFPDAFYSALQNALYMEFGGGVKSQYTIGVGGMSKDLRQTVSQSILALEHRIFFERKDIIHIKDIEMYANRFKPETSALRGALRARDRGKIIAALEQTGGELLKEKYSYHSVQSFYNRALILPNEVLDAYMQEERASEYPKHVYSFFSIGDMLDFIGSVYNEALDEEECGGLQSAAKYQNEAIESVKEYIDRHFAEEISLREISGNLHINYCYLSILFKEIMKINFRDYVVQARISRAKEYLLHNANYKIKDVADMTGFTNQHYFSKIFRQETGLTPKSFREMRKGV
ncbi:MAG: response regulator [Clostridiales bacterium]|jgi:YesN/AraC family two-component response regulator|nr:response regulator [Clostridiales bacterium]